MAMSSEERRRRMHQAMQTGSAAGDGTEGRRRRGASVRRTGMTERTRETATDDFMTAKSGRTEPLDGAAWPEREERPRRSRRSENTESREFNDRRDGTESRSRSEQPERSREGRPERGTGRHSRRGGAGGDGPDLQILVPLILAIVLIIALLFGIRALMKKSGGSGKESSTAAVSAETEESTEETTEPEPETAASEEVLAQASLLAAQYDYDAAIDLLKEQTDFANDEEAQMAVKEYEEIKSTLVRQDLHEITHVFFHILMPNPKWSMDSSKFGKQADGYNSLMTTVDEFNKMLEEMYRKGFVLVGLHDMAHIEKQADGTEKMVENDIMLPPGKKGVVMSEDDVCYYEYMEGAWFADKMIIGEDGRPTTHMTDPDGTEHVGAYDVVPLLDEFIDKHPDFSYRGSKAIIAFTGYNGILGYRTDETYEPGFDKNAVGYGSAMTPNPNIEEDRKEAVKVLKALVADGYELSSHSWGHKDMGAIDMKLFRTDCNRWDKNVNSLIKEATGENCDIMIYPKGADVENWHNYTHANERFDYMYQKGFRYFCNVDSSQYWVQLGDDYVRQGRRALDGYNMWIDIHDGKNRLNDLFDNVSEIFDSARSTPVPPY